MKNLKPILFNIPMVQAIVEGKKTQTRRIVKFPVIENANYAGGAYIVDNNGDRAAVGSEDLPGKYKKGDVLWVQPIANKIFLEVIDVRVERLQDITTEDAKAEGIKELHPAPFVIRFHNYLDKGILLEHATSSFMTLWCSIYGRKSYESNPWVFVYEFKISTKPSNF